MLDELHLHRTGAPVNAPGGQRHEGGRLEHSGVVYLFGPGDEATVLHSGGTTDAQYASDISRLLSEG